MEGLGPTQSASMRISHALQQIDLAGLTSRLVQIPSYSHMPQQEDQISQYIVDYFSSVGIAAERIEIAPGRFNVVASLPGRREDAPSLMLSGHMDTVPAYDMEDAFAGTIRDGTIYGRGTCDMKGPLAAMMAAMTAIHQSGVQLDGTLYFTGVADEEEKGLGAKYLVEHGPAADATIVGEPTDMQLALGHKGLEWIEVVIHGKKVHGGNQDAGVNAIEMAGRFIDWIERRYRPVLDTRRHPVLGAPTINLGTIQGGDQPSTVPDRCTICLDRRCVPSESIAQVYAELEEGIQQLQREDPRFCATVSDLLRGETLPHIPFCTDLDAAVVRAAAQAIGRVGEREIVYTTFPAWTDAGFLNSGTRSTCIVMGPGELSKAHSIHESIPIQDLDYAARVYAETALAFCGVQRNEEEEGTT